MKELEKVPKVLKVFVATSPHPLNTYVLKLWKDHQSQHRTVPEF